MSSQSKRRAESEEVAHKKKPRKGGDEEDVFNQDDDKDDDADALGTGIPTIGKARGKRVDYTKVGLDDNNGFEAEEEALKEKNGALVETRTRSPEREPAKNIGEVEEDDDEEDEEGEYEDEGDEGSEDYEEDEDE